jgi:UDP-2,3-diacylglucosamine pyrophosphatase LpxH
MKKLKKTHAIIISDLHLGSAVSQPKKALAMLKGYSFRKLVLLGDIFDSLDFRHLNDDCWEFLKYVGKISREKKVRWVIGNHDVGLTGIFSSLVGAKIYKTYIWHYQRKTYLAIHGHQFDRFLINNAFLSYLATRIYNYIQRIDFRDMRLSHFLKRTSKGWLRLSSKVARGALRYGKKYRADFVFCGHTHKAMEKKEGQIHYYNSGCWTDTPCQYITIDKDKGIEIHEY